MKESPELGFGEELRRERQIRGISLEEISSATKISVRLLSALERGDVKQLPAPAFTRGFIRAYSTHLGIDADEIQLLVGDAYYQKQDFKQAAQYFDKYAAGRKKIEPEVQYKIGYANYKQGDFKGAINSLKTVAVRRDWPTIASTGW